MMAVRIGVKASRMMDDDAPKAREKRILKRRMPTIWKPV